MSRRRHPAEQPSGRELWPDTEPAPRIAPPDLPDGRVCQTHGIPRLASGRCSFCVKLPAPPVAPRPRSAAGRVSEAAS